MCIFPFLEGRGSILLSRGKSEVNQGEEKGNHGLVKRV